MLFMITECSNFRRRFRSTFNSESGIRPFLYDSLWVYHWRIFTFCVALLEVSLHFLHVNVWDSMVERPLISINNFLVAAVRCIMWQSACVCNLYFLVIEFLEFYSFRIDKFKGYAGLVALVLLLEIPMGTLCLQQ